MGCSASNECDESPSTSYAYDPEPIAGSTRGHSRYDSRDAADIQTTRSSISSASSSTNNNNRSGNGESPTRLRVKLKTNFSVPHESQDCNYGGVDQGPFQSQLRMAASSNCATNIIKVQGMQSPHQTQQSRIIAY